jgi:TrmH family RNA methyltransferase
MDAMSPVRSPSGIIAIATRSPNPVDRVFAAAPALILLAAGVQDPGNLGAIIRSAEAGGATGLIVSGGADPFGWKALRGAMGSAFRLPIALEEDARTAIAQAKRRTVRVLAAAPGRGSARSLYEIDLTCPVMMLVGAEGPGLGAELIALADEVFTIPMKAPVESLNVAVSAGLAVYEAARQRRAFR